MNTKRKIVAWLLVIIMMLQVSPLGALAEKVTYSNELRVDFNKVTFVNGNQSIVQYIKQGEGGLVFPETPTSDEEGVSFVGWMKADGTFVEEGATVSEDMTLTAQFDAPTYYTVTILYQYNGVDVANANGRAYRPQDNSETIESPSPVPNPDKTEGGYLFPAKGNDGTGYSFSDANVTINPSQLTGDVSVVVNYQKAPAQYTVRHKTQNLNAGKTGVTDTYSTNRDVVVPTEVGAVVRPEDISIITIPGFEEGRVKQQSVVEITGTDTVIEVEYNRSQYLLTYDTQGGSYVESEMRYYGSEQALSSVKPTRQGFSFAGWYNDAAGNDAISGKLTMPAGDKTVYAQWTPINVNYTIVYLTENADDEEYSFLKSETKQALNGSTVSSASAPDPSSWSDGIHFTRNDAYNETQTIAADGSTVLTVKYTRNVYNITYVKSQGGLICGKEEHTHTTSGRNPCYTNKLICNKSEHTHSYWNGCYNLKGKLTCSKTEHTHNNNCYQYTLTCNKTEHTHTDACYSTGETIVLTAKYGANITDTFREKFTGDAWSYEKGNDNSKTYGYDTMPGEDKELFYYSYSSGANQIYVNYWLENYVTSKGSTTYNGKTYGLYKQVKPKFNSLWYPDDFYPIDGYTQTYWKTSSSSGSITSSTNGKIITTASGGTYDFYYDAKSYQLELFGWQGVNVYKGQFKLGADISSTLSSNVPAKPINDPECTWKGWFEDPEHTVPYTGNKKMTKGLTLYGDWNMPSYDVEFLDSELTVIYSQQHVEYGQKLREIDKVPEREGYVFIGWYTNKACTDRFDFNEPVTSNQTNALYAGWKEVGSGYTVYYKSNVSGEVGKELSPSKTVANDKYHVGMEVEEAAIGIKGYRAHKLKEKITLSSNAPDENVITFWYDTYEEVNYTVKHLLAGTTTEVCGATTGKSENTRVVIFGQPKVNYNGQVLHPTAAYQVVELAGDETQNVFNFEYSPYTTADVTINYYTTNSTGGNAELKATEVQKNVIIGESVLASVYEGKKSFDGYEFNHADKDVVTPATGDTEKVMNLYYSPKKYAVTYKYVPDGYKPEGAQASPGATAAYYTADVTVAAAPAAVPGYTFSGWSTTSAGVNIQNGHFIMPANKVEFTGTWTANTNTAYKVEHYKQQTDGTYMLAETENKTGTTDTDTAAAAKTYDGFTAQSFAQQKIKGDGTTVVKIKYDLKQYDLTLVIKYPGEADQTVAGGSYPYGTQITKAQHTVVNGTDYKVPRKGYKLQSVSPESFNIDQNNNKIAITFQEADNVLIQYQADTNGRVSLANENVAPVTGNAQGSTAVPNDGYVFINWTDKNGTVVSTSANFVPSKTDGVYEANTYTAHFAQNKFNVTYNYTGTVPAGAPAVPAQSQVTYGTANVAVAVAPTLTGYTFSGWNTADVTVSGGKFTMPGKNVTFTGSWTKNEKLTVTQNSITGQKYDGNTYNLDTFTITASDGKTITKDQITGLQYTGSGKNAGTVTGTCTGPATVTINGITYDVAYVPGTLKITKRDVTLTSATKSKTYDGQPLTDSTITVGGDGFVSGEGYTADVTGTITNVGHVANAFTYALNSDTLSSNYNITKTEGTLTINKASIEATFTVADKTAAYNGTVQQGNTSVTVTGLLNGHTASYTYTPAGGKDVNTYTNGSYSTIRIMDGSIDVTENYHITAAAGKLTITKKDVTVTAAGKSKVYGAADPELTAAVTGLVDGETLNYSLSRATGENVDTYAISVTLGDNPNYEVSTTGANFEITKKAATVTAENKTKVYGETDPELTATVTGLVGSDTLNYSLSRATGENVKTYNITVTLGDNPNYEVSTTGATFTITPATLTITTNSSEKVYDGTPLMASGTIDGFKNNETATFTLTGAQKDVGHSDNTYTLSFDQTAAAGNYVVTSSLGTLTVTKRTATITVNPIIKEYGAADPDFGEAVVTGQADNELTDASIREVVRTNSDELVDEYKNALTTKMTKEELEKQYPNYTFEIAPASFIIVEPKVPPQDGKKETEIITKTHTAKNGGFVLGEKVEFQIEVRNIYNSTQTIQLTELKDVTLAQSTFENVPAGEYRTTTATYTIQEKDILNGKFVNTVTITYPGTGVSYTASNTAIPEAVRDELTVAKTAKTDAGVDLDNTITYTVTVKNTGNVTVSALDIADKLVPGLHLNKAALAPNETDTVTYTYTVTEDDILAGEIKNQVEIAGTDPNGTSVKGTAENTVKTADIKHDLKLEKTSDRADAVELNDVITYKFTATNNGNVTISNLFIEDGKTGNTGINALPVGTLKPGDSKTVTASYTVTEEDVLNGSIFNAAVVKGTDPKGTADQAEANVTNAVKPGQKKFTVTKETILPADREYFLLGEAVPFRITVNNVGNVSLYDLLVTEDQTVLNAVFTDGSGYTHTDSTATIAKLEPGTSVILNAAYTVQPEDLGKTLINTVTAKAQGFDPDYSGKQPENPEPVTASTVPFHTDGFVDVEGTKIWKDNDNALRARPGQVTIRLFANDAATGQVAELSEATGWNYSFKGLPVHDDRNQLIEYTVDEDPVENYTKSIDGYNVTNTLNSCKLTIRYWYDEIGGRTAYKTFTKTYLNGESYRVVSPAIAGYTPDEETVTGILTQDEVIDVVYTRDRHNLTIHYIFENGSTAAKTYEGTFYVDEHFAIPSPELAGYQASRTSVTGTMHGKDLTYTVVYLARLNTTVIDDYETPLGLGGIMINAGECFE